VAAGRDTSMELSDDLICLFNAEVEHSEDGFAIEVPEREVETGSIDPGEVYRVALLSRGREADTRESPGQPDRPQPPAEEEEIRYVEIEDLGKQGDGIARVERGYVIIVPGTDIGERVKIEITEVKSNFAVGEVIEETFE